MPKLTRKPLFFALCVAGALLSFAVFRLSPAALFSFATCILLSWIALVDAAQRIIPNQLVIALLALGCVAMACQLLGVAFPQGCTLPGRIAGLFAASVPLLLVAMVTNGFGGGDVKLLGALGFLLGWKLVLLALVIGLVLGGCYGIVLLATKRGDRGTKFAFGPALCAGAAIALLWGNQLLGMYLGAVAF